MGSQRVRHDWAVEHACNVVLTQVKNGESLEEPSLYSINVSPFHFHTILGPFCPYICYMAQ